MLKKLVHATATPAITIISTAVVFKIYTTLDERFRPNVIPLDTFYTDSYYGFGE